MVLNKLYLMYDTIIDLDNDNRILIDNNKFTLYKSDGTLNRDYAYGFEILKGIFLLYNMVDNKYILMDRDLRLIQDLGNYNIGYKIAKMLDNLDYTQILNAVNKLSTKLDRQFICNKFKNTYNIKKLEINLIDINKIVDCNYKLLRITDNNKMLESVYKDGQLEISFFKYNNFGHIIDIKDKDLILIWDNDTTDANKMGKVYYLGNYIGDTQFINVLNSTKEYIYCSMIADNKQSILKINKKSNKYEIILDNIDILLINNTALLIQKDNKNRLYDKEFNSIINYDINFEYSSINTKILYYDREGGERVYLLFGKDLKEICTTHTNTRIDTKKVYSHHRFIRGIYSIIDKTNNNTISTVIIYKPKIINNDIVYREEIHTDMREFWDKIISLDIKENTTIYIGYKLDTGLYYIINKKGEIMDTKGYKGLKDIKKEYLNI